MLFKVTFSYQIQNFKVNGLFIGPRGIIPKCFCDFLSKYSLCKKTLLQEETIINKLDQPRSYKVKIQDKIINRNKIHIKRKSF